MAVDPHKPHRRCDQCGASSPYLLKCSGCKMAWYCDVACQSLAWKGGTTGIDGVVRAGHRAECRRTRRTTTGGMVVGNGGSGGGGDGGGGGETTTKTPIPPNGPGAAYEEMMRHVMSIGPREAYMRMCLARDEVRRLEQQQRPSQRRPRLGGGGRDALAMANSSSSSSSSSSSTSSSSSSSSSSSGEGRGTMMMPRDGSSFAADDDDDDAGGRGGGDPIIAGVDPTTNRTAAASMDEPRTIAHDERGARSRRLPSTISTVAAARGSWLDRGHSISVEYLPNVGSYRIVLLPRATTSANAVATTSTTANSASDVDIVPSSMDGLFFTLDDVPSSSSGDDGLDFEMTSSSRAITYLDAKLYRSRDVASSPSSRPSDAYREGRDVLLLSVTLPTPSSFPSSAIAPRSNATMSLDVTSISLRVRFRNDATPIVSSGGGGEMASHCEDMTDELLGGGKRSSFSSASASTCPSALNRLRCRSCQNQIIDPTSGCELGDDDNDDEDSGIGRAIIVNSNDNNRRHLARPAVIGSVLPLPSGYWDDVSDYLICYGGQPTVDLSSSSASAIRGTALEDDAVLVLHGDDLAVGGTCTLDRVMGYGMHSSAVRRGGGDDVDVNVGGDASSRAWRDRAAVGFGTDRIVTCANCCSTLGYVSDHDSNTYRLYKHLLDCGEPGDPRRHVHGRDCDVRPAAVAMSDSFLDHYCGSFLAREMVRYAESDAVFTFVVGLSDEDDWTRTNAPNQFILLRILSWDSLMSTVMGTTDNHAGVDDESRILRFQRVVKVIFEEASDEHDLQTTASNGINLMEWTLRGTDFCCPAPLSSSTSSNTEGSTIRGFSKAVESSRAKASSIRIFFSKRDFFNLKEALIQASRFFPSAMKDAAVMTKLGSSPGEGGWKNASLSFLPLV